jgi:hypothetical protein
MHIKTMFLPGAIILISCQHSNSQYSGVAASAQKPGKVIDIPLPEGYERITYTDSSFATWLRQLSLKPDNTVYLYNKLPKANQDAQYAVLDMSVGDKNLQQCADAVMRLRAEYLFEMKDYRSILFTDNEGTSYPFTAPFEKDHLAKYLEKVFGMCGSASLSKQLKEVHSLADIRPGDVFIRGGFPGHAATVMDVAMNKDGKKIFLLSQSYMPAQDIHILKNPANENGSPWYESDTNATLLVTPEYTFKTSELKGW